MATTTTNIKINIVEPGDSTSVDPTANTTTTTTDISVPDTGLFTHGIGGTEAAIITISIVAILAVVATVLHYKKKHHNKATESSSKSKLTNIISSIKSKKKVSIPLAILALVVSLGTLAALLVNAGKGNTSAIDNTEENEESTSSLTLDIDSEELTIEVGDEPVFAYLPVKLTVEEVTAAGYTLTAYTESTDIVSTTDPSNKIPMVTLPEPIEPNEEGVGKGWSLVTTLTDNTWGLSLTEPQDQNSKVYTTLSTDQDVPTILKFIDDYSETEENDTTTIYYGFYITPDIPKGIYEGSSINYSATPNYITTLSFNGNDNDGGEDMDSIIIPAGTIITLPENTYAKDGYHFTDWNTDAEGTGEAYADEAEYTAIAGESANITLYAQWEEDGPTIGDLTYMQDFKTLSEKDKATVLRSMVEDEQYQLIDNRDSKTYYISRLKDGNVWMTQNLDLDLNNRTTLTPENTNISANWTPANSTISFTGTSVSGWGYNYNVPYSADPGDVYYYTSGIDSSDIQYNSFAECEAAGHTDCAHYHAGNYYNWTAVVANNNTSGITEQFSNAPDSICPAGWRLPEGPNVDKVNYNEMVNLIASYDNILDKSCGESCASYSYLSNGFNNIRMAPLWLVRPGLILMYSPPAFFSSQGGYGYYWSSTAGGNNDSYELNFLVNSISVGNTGRNSGRSVRCLAE